MSEPNRSKRVSIRRVYGRGEPQLEHSFVRDDAPIARKPAADTSVDAIMTREITCARAELGLDDLTTLFVNSRVGCLPIVDERGAPIGMVTKTDVVDELFARRDDEAPLHLEAREIMMPLAFVLEETASIAHAAALMTSEGVHHVPIVDRDGAVVGLISSLDIVRWVADEQRQPC